MSRLPVTQTNLLHRMEVSGLLYDDMLGTSRPSMLALENKGLVELITDEDMDLCWVLCEEGNSLN